MQFMTSAPNFRGSASLPEPVCRNLKWQNPVKVSPVDGNDNCVVAALLETEARSVALQASERSCWRQHRTLRRATTF